jgi:alkyl hydroperoxide reductase subunit D
VRLQVAVVAERRSEIGPAVVDDAVAAAAVMAMNNVYYRFRLPHREAELRGSAGAPADEPLVKPAAAR